MLCLPLLIRSTSLSCVAVYFPILSGDALFFAFHFFPFWCWWLSGGETSQRIVGSCFLNPGHSESKPTCESIKKITCIRCAGVDVAATRHPHLPSVTATRVPTCPPAWSDHCTHAWLLEWMCFWKGAMGKMPHFKWLQAIVCGVETRGSIQSLFSLHALEHFLLLFQ